MKKIFTAFRYDSGQISTSKEQPFISSDLPSPNKARPVQHLPSQKTSRYQDRKQDFASRNFPDEEVKNQDFDSKHGLYDKMKNHDFASQHFLQDKARNHDFASQHFLQEKTRHQDFASQCFPQDEKGEQDFASQHFLQDEAKNQYTASQQFPQDETMKQDYASQYILHDKARNQKLPSQNFLQDKARNSYFQHISQDEAGIQNLCSQHFLHDKARNQVFASQNFVQDKARLQYSASQHFLQYNARNQDFAFQNCLEEITVGNRSGSGSPNSVLVGGLYGNVNVTYHKTDMETASAFNQGSSSPVNSFSNCSIKQEEKNPYLISATQGSDSALASGLTSDAETKSEPCFPFDFETRSKLHFTGDARIKPELCLLSKTMSTDARMRQNDCGIKSEPCTESSEIQSNDIDASKPSMNKPDNAVSKIQVTTTDTNVEKVVKVTTKPSGKHRNWVIKPPYTYSAMCIMAIEMSEAKALTIGDIKEKVHSMFPHFQNDWLCWRERIGHCVTTSRYFSVVDVTSAVPPNMHVRLWKVDHSTLKPKMFRRTRHDSSTAKQYKEYLHDQLGVPSVCKVQTLTNMRKLAPVSSCLSRSVLASQENVKKLVPKRVSQDHLKKSASQRKSKTTLPALLPSQKLSNKTSKVPSDMSGKKKPKPLSKKPCCKTTMLPSQKCSEKAASLPSPAKQSVLVKSEVYDSKSILHALADTDKRGDEMTSPSSISHTPVCSMESLCDKENQNLILDLSADKAESAPEECKYPLKKACSPIEDNDFTNLVDCKTDDCRRQQIQLNQTSNTLPDRKVPSYQVQDDHLPHHQVPNYQVPSYQVPNYQVPNYQVPNYQQPNYQVPNYQMLNNMAGFYPHMNSLPYMFYRQSTEPVPAVSSQGQSDSDFTSQLLQDPRFVYLRDYSAGLQLAMSMWYYEQCRARAVAEQDKNQSCDHRTSHTPTTQPVKTSPSQKVKPDKDVKE